MAGINSFEKGAYHIANNQVEYNPQRKNNFTLVVQGLTNLKRVGAAEGTTDPKEIIADGQKELILGLKSSGIPKFTQSPVTVNRGNSEIKFAGKPKFDNFSISAYDYIGSNIKDTLMAWQQLSYNSKYDYVGSKSSYKKNCTLWEYTPAGDPVRYWEIKGAWLTSVTPDDFDVTADDVATVSAEVVYDWAEMHLPDE